MAALCLTSLLGVAGCAGGNRAAGDPLFGGSADRPINPAPPAPSAAVAPLPPPKPNSLTSNAALAGGPTRSLDNDHDLRIKESSRHPDSRYTQEQSGGAVPRPAVPTGEFEARNPSVPAQSFQPAFPAGGRVASYEQAQALLAARGVTWQRLETWGDRGEWKFTCSVPNRQNAYISRNYEARARDYLSAIHAVLEQMGKER